jgi:ABC-type uncharacterized transport system permease subunit
MAHGLLRYGSWTGIFVPFAIWMGYFIAVYAAVSIGCVRGLATTEYAGVNVITLALVLIAALTMVAMLVFGWIGYRGWRTARDHDAPGERARFAGVVTMLVTGLAVVATLWVALPVFMLHPCQ